MTTELSTSRPASRRSFWRFAFIWLVLIALAWGVARLIPAESRQKLFYREVFIGLAAVIGLLVGVAFSSWSGLKKLGAFALFFAAVGGFFSLFRLQGVDGNLIPVFESRWRAKAPPPVVAASTGAIEAPPVPAGASDWPQFFGPSRNTLVPGPPLVVDAAFASSTPLWRRPVGVGWSGFVVSGGWAITQEQQEAEEWTVAYRLSDGEPLWKHVVSARYDGKKIAGDGPRANPTVVGDRVYVAGSTGMLSCLSLSTGQPHWQIDLMQTYGTKVPDWGYSISPLVDDGLVIMPLAGQSALIARRADDGSAVWVMPGEADTYASASVATLAGKKQILHFGGRALEGVDPATGKKIWSYPWSNPMPHVAMPIIIDDDELILSSGYGAGAARIKLSPPAADGTQTTEEIWKTLKFRAKFAQPTIVGDHLYGLDDGVFACLDIATGDRLWREGDFGHGQQLRVGPHLLVMAENGQVQVIDPQPSGLRVLSSFRAFEHQTWNPPVLAGEYLLLRNDREAACYRVRRGS
jgi:outer membrane protein assembly factor BamB